MIPAELDLETPPAKYLKGLPCAALRAPDKMLLAWKYASAPVHMHPRKPPIYAGLMG